MKGKRTLAFVLSAVMTMSGGGTVWASGNMEIDTEELFIVPEAEEEDTQEENIFDDAEDLLNDGIIEDENSEIISFDDGVSAEMSAQPEFDDGTSDIEMEFQDGEKTELFAAENADAPDYDIWLSDTIRSGLSVNGTSHGNGLYVTFKSMQEPIYAELGGLLLDNVPLSFGSAYWYNLMNHDFYDNQKLIYEALIMDYLKYSDTKSSSSFNTSQIDRANSYLLKIFDDLAKQFLNEGVNNWTPEEYMNLSVEDASKYFERVSDMKKTVGLVKKAAKNTKELVTLAANMRALEDAKEERVQMLTYARNACADMSSPNQDFIKACDEILAQIKNTSIDVSYVINSTATKGREKIMDKAWGKLCDASPVLKVIDRGAGAMDIIFNTSDNAANNLKLELLYTMDSYFQMGLNNASLNYQYVMTSESASAFNGCFEGYVEFQMYGNNFAKSWIGGVVDGGTLNHAFAYIFYRENIKNASELKKLCDSQNETRKNILNLIGKYQDIYNGLYMKENYKAALENAPVADAGDEAQTAWKISDGIESALGRGCKVVDKGQCGERVYWKLFDDGTLIIHGYGEMEDYSYNTRGPWSRGCTVKVAVISDGVTDIGEDAFWGCGSLSSVTIPSSVTSIGSTAFSGCSSLGSVTIPSSVTSISYGAFRGCSSLSKVTIPNSVTSIRNGAFSGCSSLSSITIPNSVTSIEGTVFYGCYSLSSVTIPNSVTSIGNGAFEVCSSLSSVTIPNSVTSISYDAFRGCSSLSSITIPNSVTSISYGAFSGCSSLSSITIPNSVTSIGDYAFSGCSSLSSITIPNSVTSIGREAFSGCSSLSKVIIPNSVTSIGWDAFYGRSSKLVIYGNAGSEAESSARLYDIKFQILGHTHTYGKYTVTKKPTCTEPGTKKKVCTACDAEVTESIPATGHTWNSGKITKAATASATGIKTYTCTVCKATKTEIIPKKTLVNNTITASNITRTYSAKAQTFYLNVKRKGSGKITYSSNNKSITVNSAGKVTVKAKYTGKATITVKVAEDGTYKAAAKKITITVNKLANVITASNITRTYSSKAQTFSIGAKRKGTGKLTYSSNNSKVAVNSSGKITVKAKFIGKATITIKVAASSVYKAAAKKITVTVNPTKTALSSISNVKGKKIAVKWKKNTAGTGYQIQYSTSKTFASGNKTVSIIKNSAVSRTITGLSKGKTYYVRIRTYKTVSGKKYYSGWSTAKHVKINK